ncbi:hypothetical protein [Abyssibacter sp.]|uniref:hypothetical protein n=1 Tax=Abyssibacter sp. TaxID=2320200 RepID=UPI0025C719C1|nr:hypothetical protein [Abyssibacter sp.]MCK5858423.1 hypothetical protein [Abyssibacter sp.]
MKIDTSDTPVRACLRFGWTALVMFLLLGLTLEFLHLVKAPWYLDLRIRRELWVLAHAHGALLALLNLAFAATAGACITDARSRALASVMLRWGSGLVPAGFLLGGVGNTESDPSLAIVLTPIGALMVLYAFTVMSTAAWRLR